MTIKTDGWMGFQKLITQPASKSPAPVPPRALGELADRLKNYHHLTVVWSMLTVFPEMWQLLQPYCIQCCNDCVDQFTLEGCFTGKNC